MVLSYSHMSCIRSMENGYKLILWDKNLLYVSFVRSLEKPPKKAVIVTTSDHNV